MPNKDTQAPLSQQVCPPLTLIHARPRSAVVCKCSAAAKAGEIFMRVITLLAAALATATVATASQGALPVAVQAAEVGAVTIPANTSIILRMNEDLTSKGGQIKAGHMFNLTVAYDVKVNGIVVIPAGTPGKGEVTMRTGKGVFGKSGKLEVELRSIDLNGEMIPVTGKYRQEGEGNTLAAVGAVFLSAPLLFVTGKSATIPRGRELTAYTLQTWTVTAR